jgi:hypothetical protein
MNRNFIVIAGLTMLAIPAVAQYHIHELYYNNAYWADTDLTAATGGPGLSQLAIAPLAAFYTTPNNQLHVYYPFTDQHVHQLYNNGRSWTDEDLTAATGGATIALFGPLSGFSIGNAQYVYFCGADGAVHQYAYGAYGANPDWNWIDTRLPMGNDACGAGPVAFATTPNDQLHVYYVGNNASVHQLYFNGLWWSNENLTQEINGAGNPGNSLYGFANGNFQYVYFQSSDAHIHEYSYVDNWADTDLTVAAGGVPSSLCEGMAAFVVPGTTQKEVYYGDPNCQDLHRMTFQNNEWTDTDLSTIIGGAPLVNIGFLMFGFATPGNDQLHIYLTLDNSVFLSQLYFNGAAWFDEQLPSVGGFATAEAGFAIGNLQHVYYFSDLI